MTNVSADHEAVIQSIKGGNCEICGKPPSQYPNWLLSKGHAYHVGCLAKDYTALRADVARLTADLAAVKHHRDAYQATLVHRTAERDRLRAALERALGVMETVRSVMGYPEADEFNLHTICNEARAALAGQPAPEKTGGDE